MPNLRVPTPLRTYTAGKSEVVLSGNTVFEALEDMTRQYPDIKQHIFNDEGELRPFINLFLGEDNIHDLQGLNTPLDNTKSLMLIPSIAGGNKSH